MGLVYVHRLEEPYKLSNINNLSLDSQIWMKLKLNKQIKQVKTPSASAPQAANTETACSILTNRYQALIG